MGAVALIAGMAALAWAGPEAVLNVEKPAPSRGTPAVFKFGGDPASVMPCEETI